MKKYIGTKVIDAEPQVKDGVDGYKVVYDNPNNKKYESWSPKDVFEKAYTELSLDKALVQQEIVDIFSEANKEYGEFIPQKYMWVFLELCYEHNITFKKDK